jgi:hypothetical protein
VAAADAAVVAAGLAAAVGAPALAGAGAAVAGSAVVEVWALMLSLLLPLLWLRDPVHMLGMIRASHVCSFSIKFSSLARPKCCPACTPFKPRCYHS